MGSMLIRREALGKTGDFDESLRTHSDYDLWLRVAFHFQFLFLPGRRTRPPRGLWLSLGDSDDGVRVVRKALEMLPDSREYAALKREATARAMLGTLTSFIFVRDVERIWPRLSQIFRGHPWVAPYPWAQGYLSYAIQLLVAASQSPLTRVRDICAQLRLGLREAGEKDPRRVRQLGAELWATAAAALADEPDGPVREMIWAAARALAYDPWSKHRGALLRLLARGCLGPRPYGRLKRFITPMTYGPGRR